MAVVVVTTGYKLINVQHQQQEDKPMVHAFSITGILSPVNSHIRNAALGYETVFRYVYDVCTLTLCKLLSVLGFTCFFL